MLLSLHMKYTSSRGQRLHPPLKMSLDQLPDRGLITGLITCVYSQAPQTV